MVCSQYTILCFCYFSFVSPFVTHFICLLNVMWDDSSTFFIGLYVFLFYDLLQFEYDVRR